MTVHDMLALAIGLLIVVVVHDTLRPPDIPPR